jgi:hypothetical protein
MCSLLVGVIYRGSDDASPRCRILLDVLGAATFITFFAIPLGMLAVHVRVEWLMRDSRA